MAAKRRSIVIPQLLFLLGFFALPLAAQTAKRIWVLRGPDEILEYDALTFAAKQTIKVPPQVFKSPEGLAVNSQGQMLFVPGTTGDEQAALQNPGSMKVWFRDGQTAAFLDLWRHSHNRSRGHQPFRC